MPTLYDKYGGTPTMKILVREFYKQARVNPKVGHYFSHLDMEKLIDHQVQFLSVVLGKPARTYLYPLPLRKDKLIRSFLELIYDGKSIMVDNLKDSFR
jgi:truncated hemoglobin YjbI